MFDFRLVVVARAPLNISGDISCLILDEVLVARARLNRSGDI